jgi:hypothetical protein
MVDHTTKRILLASGFCLSTAACATTIAPRVIAWNIASQGVFVASSRATNCRLLNGPIAQNTIPIDSKTNKPLVPGTHVCSWDGNTGQINGNGVIDYLKQGQPEEIAKTLKQRGFKP